MPAIIINKISKALIVGPIYDKVDYLNDLNYDHIILNGGLCNSNFEKIKELTSTNKVIYLASRNDYLSKDRKLFDWINTRPNIAIIEFANHKVLTMDGGIPTNVKNRNDLMDNLEISFINIDWHKSYNGGLGYVISNGPLTNGYPKFYNYSMQLGNIIGPDSKVYAQEVDEIGLKQIIPI